MVQQRHVRRYFKYFIYSSVLILLYIFVDMKFPGNPEHHSNLERSRASKSRYHSELDPDTARGGSSSDHTQQIKAASPNSQYECVNPIGKFFLDISPQPKLKHVYNVMTRVFGASLTHDITEANVIWYWYFPYSKKKRNGIEISSEALAWDSQILNNVPGTNFFTTKEYFVTNFIRDYIPEAHVAITPYLRENKRNYKWVIKHNDHRGIALYNQQQFRKLDAKIADNTFLQRFIDNVLLIDGYKFDVALYVTLTNSRLNMAPQINIFDEWLLRFCPQKYNENHVDGYVIHDEYKHPSTIEVLNFDESVYNGRESLLEYLQRRDLPIAKTLENKMHQIIRDVVNSHTYQIEQNTERWSQDKKFNFFQMVRFDFIIDNNFKVWLMEINMSPNLDSGHFAANAVLYEKVIEWALRTGYHDRCLDV